MSDRQRETEIERERKQIKSERADREHKNQKRKVREDTERKKGGQ